MSVDRKTVERIADLARLEFDDAAKDNMIHDMNLMLEFVNKLSELDTEAVEPLIYMTEEPARLRKDEAEVTVSQKEALKNAPDKDTDFIKVPKVLSKK